MRVGNMFQLKCNQEPMSARVESSNCAKVINTLQDVIFINSKKCKETRFNGIDSRTNPPVLVHVMASIYFQVNRGASLLLLSQFRILVCFPSYATQYNPFRLEAHVFVVSFKSHQILTKKMILIVYVKDGEMHWQNERR